jgi:TolB-like protein/tetratricopeptide (TPR) repeat protein
VTRSDATDDTASRSVADRRPGVLSRLRERGVIRVAAGYAVIAWLLLQIADVTFEPLGVPRWVMISLIAAAVLGFPVAIALAWHFELGDHGLERDTAADAAARPGVHGLRRYADVAIIGVLLVAVATLLVRQSDIGKPPPPVNPAIAVLPFENLSGDPEQEYFSDGLAEEMLDRLGRVPGLTVVARSSSFSFKGKGLDAKTIADRLGVTTVLEGSVQRDGRRLRLTARLIDGATGRQAWSGSFDRDLTDVFAVQAELAAAVVAAVVPASRGEMTAAPVSPTSDLQAHDLYLLGRAAMESRVEIADAVSYLEQAVQADPNYVKAHAALSRALVLWDFYQWAPAPTDAMRRAEASAHRALSVDPQSSEAHAALGTVFRGTGNPAGAASEYKRALEINPNNAVALWDYLVLLGNDPATNRDPAKNEVATLMDRYARLDPRSPILWQAKVSAASEGVGDTVPVVVQDAVAMLADDVDGLRLVGLEARRTGYAPEAYRVSLAIEKAGDTQTAVFLAVRTWLLVDDYERARRSAEALPRVGDAMANEIAPNLLGEIAALSGDYTTWARYADLDPNSSVATCGPETAFWLAVQQRYAEGAKHLDGCDPVPEGAMGGLGAGLLGQSQLLPAMLRIYRATGRSAEANALAQQYLTRLRHQQNENPFSRLDLAALAANEGLKDEAVDALSTLFDHYPLVDFFSPRLPWFRSLERHPGYDRLMAERSRRVDKARAEMLRLEANAEGSVLQLR